MLTLLARLGLRAGEVAALRLEDIDWRAGEITVCGKGRRSDSTRRRHAHDPRSAGPGICGP
jgi:integrase